MSGISSYFDGETGVVTSVEWKRDDTLLFIVHLKDNPHRKCALDYDSDIRIDATIQPGDHVVYKQLGDYAGFWFKKDEKRQEEEILKIRGEIRRKKYKRLFLPITLTVELLMSLLFSAIVVFGFYIFRHKPGETREPLVNITFIVMFLSLTISCLFRMLTEFPTITHIKDRGIRIIKDMIKFLVNELIMIILGTLAIMLVLALTFGVALKILAPETLKTIEAFLEQGNHFLYPVIIGFSLWFLVHLHDFYKMRYSPEGY